MALRFCAARTQPRSSRVARDAFEPWFCCERDELRRYLSFSGTGGLRGRGRTHVALPGVLFDANATDQLLFNREVATALVAALPDAMLAFASLIHSAVGASEQATHVDARRDDGVKLHVPLVGVTARRGPLVLEPQRAASGCPTVVATTRLGDAVLYRHSIPHRGTANDDEVNRTALDFSFFPADGVALNDYTRDFLPERVADARAHRVRFAELCAADGLRCAGADAAAAVRQSAGFLGAVPDVGAEGFQGAYRGAGAGRGEWVDPNGSRYLGEMLDGVPHGEREVRVHERARVRRRVGPRQGARRRPDAGRQGVVVRRRMGAGRARRPRPRGDEGRRNVRRRVGRRRQGRVWSRSSTSTAPSTRGSGKGARTAAGSTPSPTARSCTTASG